MVCSCRAYHLAVGLSLLLLASASGPWAADADPQAPAGAETAPLPGEAHTSVNVTTRSADEVDLRVTSRPQPPTPETAQIDLSLPAEDILGLLPRFGAGLFADVAPEAGPEKRRESEGAPVAAAPVADTYLLAPGDGLHLRVWSRGWEQLDAEMTITPEGHLYLEQIGRITAAGRTVEQLRQMLAEAYARIFTQPSLALTVPQQRSVEVYVTGDARRPGKYTLNGNATVFTALYAAGGPSEIGSFRRLRLTRAGEQALEIDLYAYLLTGSREQDVMLRPGDTLFIPALGAEIGIAGEVRRPARYELLDPTTVADALTMAGGLTGRAYGPGVTLWYAEGRSEWMLKSLQLTTPDSPDLRQPMVDGNLVVVPALLEEGDNTIRVFGAVKRPGYYPYTEGATIGSMLRAAEGMRALAHMGTGLLTRLDENRHIQAINFDVKEQYYGGIERQMAVRPKDWIRIFEQDEVELPKQVEVRGSVARPGVYEWMLNMRVGDLVWRAGGLNPNAYVERADLLRLTEDQRYEVIAVNLSRAALADDTRNILLQRGDILTVVQHDQVRPPATVAIDGYVSNPGEYPRYEGMRASDLIFAAGGLKPGAGPGIEYTRGHIEDRPQTMSLQLFGDPGEYTIEPDVLLEDDDTLSVQGRGEFRQRAELVSLRGRVPRPGSYAVKAAPGDQPYTVWDLIREGGGLLEDANPEGIVIYRRHNAALGQAQAEDLDRVLQSVNQGAGEQPLQLSEQSDAMNAQISQSLGSVLSNAGGVSIVMPPRPVTLRDWVSAIPVDGARLLASAGREGNLELHALDTVTVPRRVNTVTVLGAVPRSGAVPFDQAFKCADYITESGGFREDAANDRLVVVHVNGSAAPIRPEDAIRPGDIIVVPTKHIVRNVRTEGEGQRWLRTIVSLVTAALIF